MRESFHLPHTVYLSALHGSQAALKSRFLMTHPAGIKQFPCRLMGKQLQGRLERGCSSSERLDTLGGQSQRGWGWHRVPQNYSKGLTWFCWELTPPKSIVVADAPDQGGWCTESARCCSGMVPVPGSNQSQNGKTSLKMGSFKRKKHSTNCDPS